jgi:hypothetical protein
MLLLLAVLPACTSQSVMVPPPAYGGASLKPNTTHRVVTTGGDEYLVTRFVVSDSLLTIEDARDATGHDVDTPIDIPLADVESMERLEPTDTGAPVMSAGHVAVASVLIVSAVFFALALSGNWPTF